MEFRCLSCGSPLSFTEGQLLSKCESCGNTYLIFDFIDKNSKDYVEQQDNLQRLKNEYDQKYWEYSDDVLEADSYCLQAKDFLNIISFFESAVPNEHTLKLICLAKLHFIKRISSYNECIIAKKYLEEIDDSLILNKDGLRSTLANLTISYRRSELIDMGYAIEIPDNKTETDLVSVLMFLIQENSIQEQLEPFDIDIIEANKREAINYINCYGSEIICNISSLSSAEKVQNVLKEFPDKNICCDCLSLKNLIAKRIDELQYEAKTKKQEQINKHVQNMKGESLMKIFSYFKRIKEPISDAKDAEPIKKETIMYIIVFGVPGCICVFINSLLTNSNIILSIIGCACIAISAIFIYFLKILKTSLKRLDNLTCKKCGAKLDDMNNITWEEKRRQWTGSNSDSKAKRTLYIYVVFYCKCPNCGQQKIFWERLCAGSIEVTNYSERENIIPTEQLVRDYINGLIHK